MKNIKKSDQESLADFILSTGSIADMPEDVFSRLLELAESIRDLHLRTNTIEKLMMHREGIIEETDPIEKRRLAQKVVDKAFEKIFESTPLYREANLHGDRKKGSMTVTDVAVIPVAFSDRTSLENRSIPENFLNEMKG